MQQPRRTQLPPTRIDRHRRAVASSLNRIAEGTELTGQDGDPETEQLLEELGTALVTNDFETGRDLADYISVLGQGFMEDISRLRAGDRWLDMGAGEGLALRQFGNRPGSNGVQLIGINIGPNLNHSPNSRRPKYSVPLLRGAFPAESLDIQEVGTFTTITDVEGAFSYTTELGTLLQAALDILRPRGCLHIARPVGEMGNLGRSEKRFSIVDGGHRLDLPDWLNTISGIDCLVGSSRGQGWIWENLEITKTSSSGVEIPGLVLTGLGPLPALQRQFHVVHTLS